MLAVAMFDLPTRDIGGYIIRYLIPRAAHPYLIGSRDTADNVNQNIASADLLIVGGHGSYDDIRSQDNLTPILDHESLPNVQGKIIWIVSCETGMNLGPALISAGAKAFIGFKEDLLWMADPKMIFTPWFDDEAVLVMKPIMDGINCLMSGKMVQEAYNVMISGLTDNLANVDDELYASMIQFNIDNAVMLGDGTATIAPRTGPIFLIPPPPIIFVP